uniref:receptor-type tyrosine-protein phosphatase alpha isoform X2 n=1 Tax=Ciona intestinalis TaxID=7719 RepID=UPI000EF509E7|nr:receptor-type tyrosine-protein phosphatase alpha isoform X2 [Ciona intestinalis]|eukprot:XP_026695761.1 receptor-type tyrosine-protein phosphatase alpha isoform X2 [Ciona intestinalis]
MIMPKNIWGIILFLCACVSAQEFEFYKGYYFVFSTLTANHAGAKSACVGLGGHLAIIPDVETQTFIQTKGDAYKSAGKWMTSNNDAYIDAVKTSDGTGWEWSTTHDKFYFKTTHRGTKGPFIVNDKYNNWHIYFPGADNYGITSSYPDAHIWRWRSTKPSLDAHYICQINVKSTSLVASKSTLNVKYGEDSVLCSSDANPGPPISWKINSQDVSTNTNKRVYQIITQPTLDGNSTSRLYLTRGLHQNSGVYTCNATSLDQSAVTTVTIEKRPRLLESKLETSTYTCIFIGETSPTIHWNANGGTVEQGILIIKNTVLNTHQVSSQITNLLIFGSTDVVSCWANNTDGSSNIISKTGFSDSPSSAITSSPGGCPGNQLQVNWTDITKTSGNIVYNVSITNSSQTYMKTLTQTSTSDNKYSITFDNLTPRTEYIIKVNLFPKYSKKIDQIVGRTTGEKPSISSASASTANLNSTFCLISWVKGPEPGIIGASIVVTSSLHRKAPGVPGFETTVTHIPSSGISPYQFETKPNRKHVITIAAKTCSEISSYIVATGQCISPVQAPANIPTPTTVGSSASTLHIQVNKADETNGPISCYLVIGGKEGSNVYRDSYTWMEIRNIIATSNSSTYCAAVLPRFNETSRQVSLLSNTTTQCKVNTSYAISCSNKLLTNGVTYKFQVVTLTSADGVYLTQTSQPIVRTITQPIATTTNQPIDSTLESSASSSTIIIAVVVVAVCMLIALVLAAYFYRKRRNVHLKHGRSQKLHFVSPEDAEQQDEEGAYVNLEVVQNPEWDILTGNLLKRYKDMLASNDAAFKKQFQELATATEEIKLQKTHAENPEHKKKNRYKNILPYDDTRVKLKETTENSDYINANYVDGYSQERKFIATQGPLDQTTGDFWRMVWEQECLVIVMLTNPVESGKKKCAKYWPDQGKRCTYDGYNVETVTEVDYGSYIVRTIHIEESNNEYASVGSIAQLCKNIPLIFLLVVIQVLRKIQHFHYIAWPDHGVPLITSSLVQMQGIVNAAESDSKTTVPIVVHCSAGAGRTGAYIGFDILLDEMKSKDQVNVFRTVLKMRKQRMDMVQNMKQYIFLHKLITECYALGNTEVDAAELEEHILQQTKMLKEFDNLSIILPLTTSQKIALQHSDDPGNRDVDVLPYDHSLVQVLGENEKDSLYLNASFITDYFPKETLIVTQDPVSTNVNAFWKAVADNNVNVIVMLSSVGNGETKDTCLPYWPDEVCQSQTYGLVKVTLVEIKKTPELIERELHVECGHIDLITTQIQCLFWEENLDTEGTKSLVNLVSIAGQLKKENGASLIHCCDGAGRSGVFCAVNNIIKRLRAENRIDVFRTVKDLRDMRPHMVRTADQYLTCYKSISAFQSSISTYANF